MAIDVNDKIIRLRLTSEQYRELKTQAQADYLSISNYMKQRIFNDPDVLPPLQVEFPPDPKLRFNCDHDKEMMRCILRAYAYAKALAMHTLEEERFKECAAVAKQQLKEWGYE